MGDTAARGAPVLTARVPERRAVAGLQYGAHVSMAALGADGWYIRLDGGDWYIALACPEADDMTDDEVLAAIRAEVA